MYPTRFSSASSPSVKEVLLSIDWIPILTSSLLNVVTISSPGLNSDKKLVPEPVTVADATVVVSVPVNA